MVQIRKSYYNNDEFNKPVKAKGEVMFNRLRKRHILKFNNHGSTLLVAVSLIAVLATVLMSMSYMNYNMKVTELNSKKNFYNAEIVLDQINVGLQKEISDSLEDAYVIGD